jgi:hypothetical protein
MTKRTALFILLTLALAGVAFAQMAHDASRPSPSAHAQCRFTDGKNISVDYSSPRMKGRKIFGGLVPYGEVWRTGANEATSFVTLASLSVGGKDVPAGDYTIFTIPNESKWTLIINKKTNEWGIPYKYESDELARVDMKVSKTPAPVEDFTIVLDQKANACVMTLSWENTQTSVEFTEKK